MFSFSNNGVPEQQRKASESLSPLYLRHKSRIVDVLQVFTSNPKRTKTLMSCGFVNPARSKAFTASSKCCKL